MCVCRSFGKQNGTRCQGAICQIDYLTVATLNILLSSLQLGEDEWAEKYRENLVKQQVDTKHVGQADGQKTGMAQINVAENGENQIVIIPGANDSLSAGDVEKAQEILDSSKVLVCQLETPLQTALAALRRHKNGISILNATPPPNEITIELFTLPTILCVNQQEAASMSKRAVPNLEWVLADAARRIARD